MGVVKEPTSTRKKGDRMTKTLRTSLLSKLGKEFEKETVLNKLAFARKNNINRATVNSLIKELDVQMDSLEVIKLDLKIVFERIKKRLFYLLDQLDEFAITTGQPNIKAELEVMKEIKNTYTDFYKLLQELGEAPKVADQLHIREEKVSIQINMDLTDAQGIKELESRVE